MLSSDLQQQLHSNLHQVGRYAGADVPLSAGVSYASALGRHTRQC